ncbi:hypothetical protein FQN54_000434 [Arachnomyces sp. PD_36]|nr:hypothetical protein FQN54_000434 [Arachnomyces sp. PD_36]
MEGDGLDFLRLLPRDIKMYQYSDFEDLKDVAQKEYRHFVFDVSRNPLVVFENVPSSEVDDHRDEFPGKIDYCSSLRILAIKLSTNPQEESVRAFDDCLKAKIRNMGVQGEASFRGAASIVETSDRRKEPDRSYLPRDSTIHGRSGKWPTVVLEAYFSQSLEQVKGDVKWWFDQSGGEVQAVITIDIKRPSCDIFVTTWERGIEKGSDPRQTQTAKVSHENGTEQALVTGDGITLKFQQLLLREPNTEKGEKDFVFTVDHLKDVGKRAWDVMGTMSYIEA